MHLEDAWVGCSLDPALDATLAASFCRELIGNGCDILACPAGREDLLEAIAPICRQDDALLLLRGDLPELCDCHGILLEGGASQFGVARAQVGAEAIVGSRVTTPDDAMLALELGVEFLLYSGALPADAVGSLPGAIGVPLFVGGSHLPGHVDVGRYRLWVESSLGMDAPAAVRRCSQALGRVL